MPSRAWVGIPVVSRASLTGCPRSFHAFDMEERARRIVESATELAVRGGFDAVRLRDVAERSGVALGTLYNRFRSKEDILVAALDAEMGRVEALIAQRPHLAGAWGRGATPEARLADFFALATKALLTRPHFARAVLRAVASGVPESAEKVIRFHGRMTALIVAVLRGPAAAGNGEPIEPEPDEEEIGALLQDVWFSTLCGWMAGHRTAEDVVARMASASSRLASGYSTPHSRT